MKKKLNWTQFMASYLLSTSGVLIQMLMCRCPHPANDLSLAWKLSWRWSRNSLRRSGWSTGGRWTGWRTSSTELELIIRYARSILPCYFQEKIYTIFIFKWQQNKKKCSFFLNGLNGFFCGKPQKKVPPLMAGPLRVGGKRPAIKEKRTFFILLPFKNENYFT